jgi:outer membrane receptor protein involved in Fe transport
MGPVGANQFYSAPQVSFPFSFIRLQGNPNLESETADTYTAGIVFRSGFQSALTRFTTSVDWYRVKIADAISQVTITTLYEQCFDDDFNPTLDPNNAFCRQLPRNPQDGTGERPTVTYNNVGTFNVEGIDLSFNWSASFVDMGLQRIPGVLSYGLAANVTINDERQDLPTAPVRDNTGYAIFGQFPWQAFSSFGYSYDKLSASLRWRHYPSMDNFATRDNPSLRTQGVGAYNIFDLSMSYVLPRGVSVRFGVDNLLDKDPPINGFNPGTSGIGSEGYDPGMIATGSVYDVLGRRYYLGMRLAM